MILSIQYVIDTCFRKIFNVKSKDVVHECETEFGVFPVTDVIDVRKKKISREIWPLRKPAMPIVQKSCNDIVCYTVSVFLV